MSDDQLLRAGAQVHVGRQPARVYRDELRRLRGVDLDEWDALRRLERLAVDARPIERELQDAPEAWSATDEEQRLDLLVRVLRWRGHAVVIALGVRAADAPTIRGAGWTEAALDQYLSARGWAGHLADSAAAELTVAIHWAAPTDREVTPELWRARLGVDGLDVGLVVQRVDRAGTPLVVAAEPRALNVGGAGRGRGRRR